MVDIDRGIIRVRNLHQSWPHAESSSYIACGTTLVSSLDVEEAASYDVHGLMQDAHNLGFPDAHTQIGPGDTFTRRGHGLAFARRTGLGCVTNNACPQACHTKCSVCDLNLNSTQCESCAVREGCVQCLECVRALPRDENGCHATPLQVCHSQRRANCAQPMPGRRAAGGRSCFPAGAWVRVLGGPGAGSADCESCSDKVRMEQLRIGQQVRSIHNGEPTYSEVYFFGHQYVPNAAPRQSFIKLNLLNGLSLTASKLHYVPVSVRCDGQREDMLMVKIEVGMCLFTEADVHVTSSSGVALARVISVSSVLRDGLYAPYTMAGDLFVDGVLASSHSDVWGLDAVADQLGAASLVTWFYQYVLLGALRTMYRLAGLDVAREFLEAYQPRMNAAADCDDSWWDRVVGLVLRPYVDAVLGMLVRPFVRWAAEQLCC